MTHTASLAGESVSCCRHRGFICKSLQRQSNVGRPCQHITSCSGWVPEAAVPYSQALVTGQGRMAGTEVDLWWQEGIVMEEELSHGCHISGGTVIGVWRERHSPYNRSGVTCLRPYCWPNYMHLKGAISNVQIGVSPIWECVGGI